LALSSGKNFWTVKKTLLTFRSRTLSNADSGNFSNFSPHVAPAFAKRMSTCEVVLETSATRRSISETRDESAGTEIARAPGRRFGRAFRAATASSQAEALRDVM
jgi:hypothetical protein